MWGKWEKLSSTAGRAILAAGQSVPRLECRLSSAHSIGCSPSRAKPPSAHMLQVDLLHHSILGRRARVQSDDHHVQANLPAANTTTHTIRNKNIKTARLACFLNSLSPSFTRVVRCKNTERT